jgi:hypothetical protein
MQQGAASVNSRNTGKKSNWTSEQQPPYVEVNEQNKQPNSGRPDPVVTGPEPPPGIHIYNLPPHSNAHPVDEDDFTHLTPNHHSSLFPGALIATDSLVNNVPGSSHVPGLPLNRAPAVIKKKQAAGVLIQTGEVHRGSSNGGNGGGSRASVKRRGWLSCCL